MIPTTKPIQVATNVETVKVRKHEVDVESLQYVLREMKAESKKTNKQIAKETNLPITKVEHWFRTDSSFAIPSDDVWFKLKEVLGIQTEVFDKQIMEFEYRDGVYESSQRVYSEDGKSPTLTASNTEQMIETKPKQVGIAADVNGHDILKRVYSPDGKSPTLSTCQGGNTEPKVVKGGAFRGRAYDKDGRRMDRDGVSVAEKTKQMLELRKDNKSNAITTVAKDSIAVNEDLTWRKLTPIECERLQTVPDNYTNHVSNTQRYKMLGNGWTIDVICHILKNMD
jgi:site-specific DNA-cytosine methylase